MKDFFPKNPMVKVRGRNSNRKTVKQTVKNGRKSRVTTPRGRHESLVPGVSSSRLRPDSDQSRIWCRARPWLACDSLNELTWVSFVVHWHLTIFFFFFFFFLSLRECCLTRQWQSTECDTRYMVQWKKFDVILRFLVDRYRRTKPPKQNPMHRSSLFWARLPKPVIGSGGLSSSRFDDDMPEVNCTWTASSSWRVKEAALWFESYGSKNLTGGTTWSSQSTWTDWLTRTHHWSSPRSKLAYKKRKLRKFPVTSGQGSKHRDWTASRWWARWRSQSSSCQHDVITWRGLIPADHEYLDSVAWPCHDCEVAPVWHHDVINGLTCQFSAVCLTVFPFEFRPRTFTIGFFGKKSFISELIILECSFPLSTYCSIFFSVRLTVMDGWDRPLTNVVSFLVYITWLLHINLKKNILESSRKFFFIIESADCMKMIVSENRWRQIRIVHHTNSLKMRAGCHHQLLYW